MEGQAALATNSFYPNDGVSHALDPANERDIAKAIAGPVAVPEPATWALLILAFVATGGAVRRRAAPLAWLRPQFTA